MGLTNIYNVISEMRTPLSELKILTEAGDLKASSEVARQTLELFNSFLYAQKLEREGIEESTYLPYSLVAATEDILDKITPFAKLYEVDLELHTDKAKKVGVSLIKKAFDHATHSLLHGLIVSLQNASQARLKIKVLHKDMPTLKFFSQDIDISFKDEHTSNASIKTKMNPYCSGISSGLLLANLIYGRMGSKLSFTSNQHGQGFGVNFKRTRQMSLVESLA